MSISQLKIIDVIAQGSRNLAWLAVKQFIRLKFPQVSHRSTDFLASWLDQPEQENPLLFDTRTQQEYAVSHLCGARQIDPDTQDLAFLNLLDQNTPIVTYCSVGYRSSAIANQLQAAGYTNVANLEGSMFQWANQGRPLYCNGQKVKQVHPYNLFWGYLLARELHAYKPL
jgi:rhodanese-related sulfurtransferase